MVGGGKVKRNPRFEKNFSRGHNPRGGGAERSNNERRGSAKSATKSPRSGDGPEETTTTAIIPRKFFERICILNGGRIRPRRVWV